MTGQGKVVRQYPMVPGIDLAGIVERSQSSLFKPGDTVVLTGWGIGERHWGGYAQAARASRVASPVSTRLEPSASHGDRHRRPHRHALHPRAGGKGVTPWDRDVVVTGAAGGVGSLAVAILAKMRYRVAASTGRPEAHEYLNALGAHRILDRRALRLPSDKPLESERWASAVDMVGGDTLAALLRMMAYGAGVAACGLAGGSRVQTTVFPFILRGVSLLGIESSLAPGTDQSGH